MRLTEGSDGKSEKHYEHSEVISILKHTASFSYLSKRDPYSFLKICPIPRAFSFSKTESMVETEYGFVTKSATVPQFFSVVSEGRNSNAETEVSQSEKKEGYRSCARSRLLRRSVNLLNPAIAWWSPKFGAAKTMRDNKQSYSCKSLKSLTALLKVPNSMKNDNNRSRCDTERYYRPNRPNNNETDSGDASCSSCYSSQVTPPPPSLNRAQSFYLLEDFLSPPAVALSCHGAHQRAWKEKRKEKKRKSSAHELREGSQKYSFSDSSGVLSHSSFPPPLCFSSLQCINTYTIPKPFDAAKESPKGRKSVNAEVAHSLGGNGNYVQDEHNEVTSSNNRPDDRFHIPPHRPIRYDVNQDTVVINANSLRQVLNMSEPQVPTRVNVVSHDVPQAEASPALVSVRNVATSTQEIHPRRSQEICEDMLSVYDLVRSSRRARIIANAPTPARSETVRSGLSCARSRTMSRKLTEYEMQEIKAFQEVYYVGNESRKINQSDLSLEQLSYNGGFDDANGAYKIRKRDHIYYRYEIMQSIGKGSFGEVILAYDHKYKSKIAIKIIKNKTSTNVQANAEIYILQLLQRIDKDDTYNVVHLQDWFCFRNHMCFSFEILHTSLYELIKERQYKGLGRTAIVEITRSLVVALQFLSDLDIIHCDLKPENIMLRADGKVKIIDFGSSCFASSTTHAYLQSRFYRSPEVLLGLPYGKPIDMWSLGCVVAEMRSGLPLFQGENEEEQVACIAEVLGNPPLDMALRAPKAFKYFDSNGEMRKIYNSEGYRRRPNTLTLEAALGIELHTNDYYHPRYGTSVRAPREMLNVKDYELCDFIDYCLQWRAEKRMTPEEAMTHQFLQNGQRQFTYDCNDGIALNANNGQRFLVDTPCRPGRDCEHYI